MYDQYFGFQESPFSVTPDPHFFYDNPVYREAYASLRYGIVAKKGFIAITGEVGTGKTTLLRKLMHDLDITVHFASIFNTLCTFNDLLWAALRDLGVPTTRQDRLAMVDDLNTYLVEQFEKNHIVCLLIDEAQNLSDESLEGLRLLSNLETNKQKLLQIVLIGQPELNAKLAKPTLRQLKQRIAIQHKIVPLNQEDVGSYINFRLGVANCHRKDLFEAEAIQRVALYSKGIPRLINILCDNALLIAFAASQKTVSAHMIREAASDLTLGSETQRTEAEHTLTLSPPNSEPKSLGREATHRRSQRKATRAVRIAFGTLLVIAVFVTAVLVSDQESFFARVLKFKPDSTQKVSLATRQDAILQKTDQKVEDAELKNTTEVGFNKWKDRVIIQSGSTVYEIATDAYEANAVLGLDLIKELNPQIQNLNRVSAGQELLLPPLTPETLVRHQTDGSYRLVIASFLGRTEAEEFAERITKAGYRVAIKPRRVSDDILLYRLEIDGLKNIDQATQTLENGLKNAWFRFARTPDSTTQDSQSGIRY
jgi:general secretion pathway protein A